MSESCRNIRWDRILENTEDHQLVVFDENVNNPTKLEEVQTRFLQLNPGAKFCNDSNQCVSLIKAMKGERVLAVLPSCFARIILKEIHLLHSLAAVVISSASHEYDTTLIDDFNKIVRICIDQDSLLEVLRQTVTVLRRQTSAFSSFHQKQKSMRNLSQDSPSFLWHRMFINVLKQMPQDDESQQDFLKECKIHYRSNPRQLEKIEKFRTSYNRERAIEWYTDECFLYRLLNACLRTEDSCLLYSFRFFIIDLCLDLERKKMKLESARGLKLYRGEMIPPDQLENWKKGVGQEISTNFFLSTSRDEKVAHFFVSQGVTLPGYCPVIYEIQFDSAASMIVCVDVGNNGNFNDEQEVIFTIDSTFKIISVDFDKKIRCWNIQLKAIDSNIEIAEKYSKAVQQGMHYYSPTVYLGRLLLFELNQIDQAEQYYNMLVERLPDDHPDIASVYSWIGVMHHKRNKLGLASEYYEKAYAHRLKQLPQDHRYIADSLYDLATIAQHEKKYEKAIDLFTKALAIYEKNDQTDYVRECIAEATKRMGIVCGKSGKLDKELEYISRALGIFREVLPEHHPHIAMCLRSIGKIHLHQGDFDKALDHFHQKLQMDELSLPSDHSYHSGNLTLIVDTYKANGDIQQALQFCKKKLDLQNSIDREDNPHVIRILMTIADILVDQDLNEALEYYDEAIDRLGRATFVDIKVTARILEAMDNFYSKYELSASALPRLLKILDLARRDLPLNHISIASTNRNIALCYRDTNNSSEARLYFTKSSAIYQANYGTRCKKAKMIAADIANLIKDE